MEVSNPFSVLAVSNKKPKYLEDKNGKKFTKAGIIPFLPPLEAKKLAELVQQFNHKNLEADECKETFLIFSQNISNPAIDWSLNIPEVSLNALESYNYRNLYPEHRYLGRNFIRPNDLMLDIMKTMWSFTGRDCFSGWDSLICIEAITSQIFLKSDGFWDRNNFSFFSGRINPYRDDKIISAASREAREEGKVIFSPKIFNLNYQTSIRRKHGLHNLPPAINICVNEEEEFYSKTYLLFMENIGTIVKQDRKGGYIYVYPKNFYKNKLLINVLSVSGDSSLMHRPAQSSVGSFSICVQTPSS